MTETKKDPNDLLLWVDVETTGLYPHIHKVLQIGGFLSDTNFNIVGREFEYETHVSEVIRKYGSSSMSDYVYDMHTRSGLLEKCEASKYAMWQIDALLDEMLFPYYAGRKFMLAGFSVHFDLGFIREHLPLTASMVHHRVFDVSTLKTACRAWLPAAQPVQIEPAHTALADAREAFNTARHIRSLFFHDKLTDCPTA